MYGKSAAIYDLLYNATGIKNFASEAEVIHGIIQQAVPGARTLLDVACGTGADLVELRRWYDVEGVDISPEMLEVAPRKLHDVPLHRGDMRRFELGRAFDAVTCLFSSIGYVTDAADLRPTIHRLAAHVARPGVLIVDGWVRPDRWRADAQGPPDVASDGKVTVVRLALTRRIGDITELDMHHLVRSHGGVEYYMEQHRLALVATNVYTAAMREAGLTTRVIPDFMPGRDRVVGVADA